MAIEIDEAAQAWLVNKFLAHNDVPEEIRKFLFEDSEHVHSLIRHAHVDVARDFVLLSEKYAIFPPLWVMSVAYTNKGGIPAV